MNFIRKSVLCMFRPTGNLSSHALFSSSSSSKSNVQIFFIKSTGICLVTVEIFEGSSLFCPISYLREVTTAFYIRCLDFDLICKGMFWVTG